jgi:hypothetical protein
VLFCLARGRSILARAYVHHLSRAYLWSKSIFATLTLIVQCAQLMEYDYIQNNFKYRHQYTPYCVAIKYHLRSGITTHMKSIAGGNLGTDAGIRTFMKMSDNSVLTLTKTEPIKNLFQKVHDGEFDEAFFNWSEINKTTISTGEDMNVYLERCLPPLIGPHTHTNCFINLHSIPTDLHSTPSICEDGYCVEEFDEDRVVQELRDDPPA